MTPATAQIEVGIDVVGSDGFAVGKVKLVREQDFQIDMKFHRDAYAPLEAVDQVLPGRVVLNIPAAQAYREPWPTK